MRTSNSVAVDMYKQLGYVIYRRVLEYYSGDPDEDAFGKNHLPQEFLSSLPRALKSITSKLATKISLGMLHESIQVLQCSPQIVK